MEMLTSRICWEWPRNIRCWWLCLCLSPALVSSRHSCRSLHCKAWECSIAPLCCLCCWETTQWGNGRSRKRLSSRNSQSSERKQKLSISRLHETFLLHVFHTTQSVFPALQRLPFLWLPWFKPQQTGSGGLWTSRPSAISWALVILSYFLLQTSLKKCQLASLVTPNTCLTCML